MLCTFGDIVFSYVSNHLPYLFLERHSSVTVVSCGVSMNYTFGTCLPRNNQVLVHVYEFINS